MNFIYKKIIIIHFLIFTFSGCGLLNKNLDIDDMPIELPSYWQNPIYNEAELTGNWWKSFNDSKFEEFIILFKENSIDLQTLVYDRKIAYYSSAVNKPGFFPSINSSARIDTNIQNLSAFGAAGNLLNNNEESQGTASSSTVNFGSTNINLGIQFQWEIDVWGTLLHSRKSIEKDYESVIYNLNYLGFSLLVRASQLYYSVLESALQVEIAEKSYKRYVEIQDYVRSKYEKGLVNSLDLRLSQSSVSTAKISLENKKNVYRSLSRKIQILLGEYPSGYFLNSYDFPSKIPKINSGVPSDLLSRRPDIKALFTKAESAGFKLKEAERNRFPKLSLIGNIGTSSNNIEDMLNIDYGVWNLGTNILSPIFNNSKIKNNINLNFELKEKSKNELKISLLQAFSEVENILYIDKSLVIQIDAINSALDESESIVKLTQDRYDKGLIGIESVLQNQAIYNTLLSQQLSLSYKNIENRLSLILALGGEIILE